MIFDALNRFCPGKVGFGIDDQFRPLLDGPFLFEWEPREEVSGTRLESPGLRALIYTWLRSDAFGRLNGRHSASILSPSLTSLALRMLASGCR